MGFKVDKNTPPMERELRYLLYDLCTYWGFYVEPKIHDSIVTRTTIHSIDFAEEILKAEGLDSN